MLRDLDLHSSFVFRFGTPTFPGTASVYSNSFGWELSRGCIRSKELDAYFSQNQVSFFPVFSSSVHWASVIHNILVNNNEMQESVTCVWDLPFAAGSCLANIAKTFAAPVALVDKDIEKQAATELKNGCYFFEPLENRRLLLQKLKGTLTHVVSGAVNARVLKTAHSMTELPGELLFSSGVLPFLSGAFALAQPDENGETLLNALLNVLSAGDSTRVIVVASVENLLGFAKALQKSLEVHSDFDVLLEKARAKSLAEMRKTRAEQSQMLLVRLSHRSSVELSRYPAFVSNSFVDAFKTQQEIDNPTDLVGRSFVNAFSSAAKRYQEWTKLEVSRAQEIAYFRFVHRLARDAGTLFPLSFDILLAAQASVDSNFALEFLKECESYKDENNFSRTLPEVDVPLERLFPGEVSRVTLRQFETIQQRGLSQARLRSVKSEKLTRKSGPVSEEKYADNSWVHTDNPFTCSFPDEDVFMEAFAFQTRSQAIEKVRAKELKVMELQSTMGEGLDIRETVRNWHTDKLMIREELKTGKADVGSIVFNFSNLNDMEKYSWQTYWNAEKHDNSHLMFYATPYADDVIGPGIARSEFGGFAVIPLDSIAVNPWDEPFIRSMSKHPLDALVLGAALVTKHRSVLLISDVAPSDTVTELLKRSGKTIIFMKLSELPVEHIRKVRTFHILAESGVREYAQKYIRKE